MVRGRWLGGAPGQGWRRVALAFAGRAADPPRPCVIKASAPNRTRAQAAEALANAKGRRAVRPAWTNTPVRSGVPCRWEGSPPVFA